VKNLKKLPKFKNPDEEFEFWAKYDATAFVDMKKSERAMFPKLKPTTKLVTLRLPIYLIDQLKALAHKKDVPYQSLVKVILTEELKQEIKTG